MVTSLVNTAVAGMGHDPLDAAPFRLGYDAIEDDKRRKPPRVRLLSEDKQLTPAQRTKLVATTRDLQRNFVIAAWMVRKHLDYVSTFSFQSRNGDEKLDKRIEELVAWWSRPQNFDLAQRHSLSRAIRLAEARRTIDGDFLFQKIKTGHVQAIEGDRIRTPAGQFSNPFDPLRIIHGVKVNRVGRALAYAVCNRHKQGAGFTFDRWIPARHVLHHGYFDRFDQVRGISPLAPAINTLQDTYENFDYALAKAKVSQLFALAFYRESDEAAGEISGAPAEGQTEDKAGYEVDFDKGPIELDLDPGDRAEFLESKQPSAEFKDFTDAMIGVALKALDIPYSFYNESFSNYSGSRQALLLYDQSADIKRQDNRHLLNALIAWRLKLWILDGTLELPAAMALTDLRWEWIHKGIPWIQPLQEIKADTLAVDGALNSRQRIAKSHGDDFWEIADELEAEENRLAEIYKIRTAAAAQT